MPAKNDGKFCPKCGSVKGNFIGVFCKTCFLEDHPGLVKIPEKLELERSKFSGKIHLQGRWIEWDEKLVGKWIASKIKYRDVADVSLKIDLIPEDEKRTIVKVHIEGLVENQLIGLDFDFPLFFRSSITHDEMLVRSDYYEAIVQIRFAEKSTEKIRDFMEQIETMLKPMEAVDGKAVVVKWISQARGFDARVVSKKAAKTVAVNLMRRYRGKMRVSDKLIGLDPKGKRKYRLTFLVRLP
jgi:NMD protein affecting ribosome stability and mRNA decay